MEQIKFNVNEVVAQLTQVAKVVSPRNTMPILSNIMFDVQGNTMNAMASDGETWLVTYCPIEEATNNVSFCVDAKDFMTALGNLSSNETITINIDNEKKMLSCNYGDDGVFKLPIADSNEYPKACSIVSGEGDFVSLDFNSTKLYNTLANVEFATANDALRPQLNGIHIDIDIDKVTCAATDGRKLVRIVDNTPTGVEKTHGFTLPKKTSHALISLLAKGDYDVNICFNSMNVAITCNDFALYARLSEGKYPNYNAVIPTNNEYKAYIEKSTLLDATRRVLAFGNIDNGLIALNFKNGSICIEAEDLDFSKYARETIPCEYDGQEMKIGFQGFFLMQVVNSIQDEKVMMEIAEPSKPILFKPTVLPYGHEHVSLLMPMILGK